MKIAIVCYPTFGGSGVVATELGIALANRGHEIHFITYKQPVRLELLNERIHFHEVHVPEYPLFQYQPYELALSSKLVDTIKFFGIELLHVHYAIPHAYAGYMAKKMLEEDGIYIPMVTTLHGTDITLVGKHPFYKPAVTFSINKSDVVTSVSENLKQSTLDLFHIKKEIHVIPNFIDKSHYNVESKECQRSLMANENERIITHISNFRKVKRIPDVIQIFKKIQDKIPAKLMMVGEGPEKEKAEELAEKLGIETESFGLAALEAMMHRVPVISSNTGGIPEVNVEGVTGFMSKVGDVDEMAFNALKILRDDATLTKFKDNAEKVAHKFDIANVLPLYESVYEEAFKTYYKISY